MHLYLQSHLTSPNLLSLSITRSHALFYNRKQIVSDFVSCIKILDRINLISGEVHFSLWFQTPQTVAIGLLGGRVGLEAVHNDCCVWRKKLFASPQLGSKQEVCRVKG